MSESNAAPEPFRVLMIDDDERLLALARLALTRDGIEVSPAATGAEGLEMVASRPDFVILDIIVPNISGWKPCGESATPALSW